MKKGRLIVGIAMIVISIILIVFGVFLMLNQNKIKFVSAIRKATSNITDDVDLFRDMLFLSEFSTSKADRKIVTTNTINYGGNLITVSGDIYSKIESREIYTNLSINSGDITSNIDLMLNNTKFYIKLKDIADKYFYTEVSIPEKNDLQFSDDQIVIMKDYFINSLFDALADNEITSTRVKLMLNDINYDVEKLEVNVSERDIYDAIVLFLKKMEDDSEFSLMVNDLFKDNGLKLANIIKELEDESSSVSTGLLLKYSIYLEKKNTILRHEVIFPSADVSAVGDLNIAIDNYTDKENRHQFKVNLSAADNSYLTFEVKEMYDNQSVITGTILGIPLINGSYTKTDTNIDLVLTVTDSMSGEQPIDYNFSYSLSTVKKDSEYKLSLKLNIPNFNFESVNSIYLNSEYPTVNVGDATPIENMTVEEANALMNYFANALPPVYEYINSLKTSEYLSSASDFITEVSIKVNAGELSLTDPSIAYYVPVSNVSTASCVNVTEGAKSPFGTWENAPDKGYAYVIVTLSEDSSTYSYYFTAKDSANYGISPKKEVLWSGSDVRPNSDVTFPISGDVVDGNIIPGESRTLTAKVLMAPDCN